MDTTIYPIPRASFFFGLCNIDVSSFGWWGLHLLPVNLGRPLCPPRPRMYSGSDSTWLWDKVTRNSCTPFCLALLRQLPLEPSHHTVRKPSSYMDMLCVGAPANSPSKQSTSTTRCDWAFSWLQLQPAEKLPALANSAWSRDELSLTILVQTADLWVKWLSLS